MSLSLGHCWPWDGEDWEWQDGYGRMNVGQKKYLAHRIALALAEGIDIRDVPPEQCVLHSCDFRPCCYPEHLRWGTKLDNALDRETRDRHHDVAGLNNPNVSLTPADVLLLRQMLADDIPKTQIAAHFGISRQQVWRIETGRRWS